MPEGFATFDHTGDLGLEVWAGTPQRLFELAAVGLMAQIAESGPARADDDRAESEVTVRAPDLPALLVDWLNAALLESELKRAVWTAAEIVALEPGMLRARLVGIRLDRSRLTFLREVKAVSHHAAEIVLAAGDCRCRVVLDI